jgi:hypothetical protein
VIRRSLAKRNHVTVIADNPQTREGLNAYLSAAGVASSTSRRLQAVSLVPRAATAVVVFPDDFQLDAVERALVSLRRARPNLLIVVVTGAPQRLGTALDPDGRSVAPLVLPKPAFGWTILDAIRERGDLAPPRAPKAPAD